MVVLMKAVKTLLLPFGWLSRYQGQGYGTKSLLTVLLFLAVYLPGPDRLVNGQSSWLEKRVSSAGLKRRYWNDELEPCIVKYCLKYQKDRIMYMKCVQRYCPAGLVTVPRELEEGDGDGDYPELSVDDVIRVCAALGCDAVTSKLQERLCRSAQCDARMFTAEEELGQSDTLSRLLPEGPESLPPSATSSNRLRLMHFSLLNLCGGLNCPSSRGADYLDCMALHCYPELSDTSSETGSDSNAIKVDQSEPELMRKRRVNAINAQCIQSRCANKSGPQRKICMINFCHGR